MGLGTLALRPLRIPEDIPVIHDWVRRDYAKYWGLQGKSVSSLPVPSKAPLSGEALFPSSIGTTLRPKWATPT